MNHDVRPNSKLVLNAIREVVEEDGFDDVLENVCNRVSEIESLLRTRELTVSTHFTLWSPVSDINNRILVQGHEGRRSDQIFFAQDIASSPRDGRDGPQLKPAVHMFLTHNIPVTRWMRCFALSLAMTDPECLLVSFHQTRSLVSLACQAGELNCKGGASSGWKQRTIINVRTKML